jgi:hypothetical protein
MIGARKTDAQCFSAHSAEGNVAQPAPAGGPTSAAQPGAANQSHIVTLDDCRSWCDSLGEAAPPVKFLSDAIAVLQEHNSRKRRSQLQSLCKHWAIEQKHAQKKRKLSEIEADIERDIVKDTQRLQKLHVKHGRFSSVGVPVQTCSAEQPAAARTILIEE